MEQLDYNLLFRWFVGLSMDDAVWDASTFSKNRERMLEGDIAEAFFQGVLGEARAGQLLSDEHFTVDGTLLEAWASHKSFRPVDPVGKDNDQEPKPPAARWDENNPTVNYRGEKRTNQTHCSTTDPQAMLARKGPGKEAKLTYHGHLMTENRSGLVVNTQVTTAYGAEESRWEQIKDTTSGSSSRNCDAWELHRMSPRTRVAAEAGWSNAPLDTRVMR